MLQESSCAMCSATNVMVENLLTEEPLSDDIPMERSPGYSAGTQPPTAATGGDGVIVLENQAYSRPPDPQIVPGTQPPTAATVGGDGQDKKNEDREPDD